jgi:hypothetical protein
VRAAIVLLAAAGLALVAGCAGPADDEEPPSDEGFAVRSERVDTDGDGATDAVRITLIAAQREVAREDVVIERNGTPVEIEGFGNATSWAPGTGLLVDCPPGTHEFRLLVRGDPAQVLVHSCGGPPPVAPPFFRANLTAVEDDRTDTIELQLDTGGPVDLDELELGLAGEEQRPYASPFKSRVATGTMQNGTAVYLPCRPAAEALNVTWRQRHLPELPADGCQAHRPGVDAPVEATRLDADDDGATDGWRLALERAGDGPFDLANVTAAWDGEPATLNGTARAPPPDAWSPRAPLEAPCPGEGDHRLKVRVQGRLAVDRVTDCEDPPGRPLVELELEETDGDRLNATLVFSHPGPLDLANASASGGGLPEEGAWSVEGTRTLDCPGGELVLRYDDRRAYRGPAPC